MLLSRPPSNRLIVRALLVSINRLWETRMKILHDLPPKALSVGPQS